MQKVYVLTELDYSLDTNVLGVFSSEEASILAREQYLEKEPLPTWCIYRRILLGLF